MTVDVVERAAALLMKQQKDAGAIADKFRAITLWGNHRRFLVGRMGGTGSTWLAKAINSHPQVFCTHEGIFSAVYPNRAFNLHDQFSFVEGLAHDTQHAAYQAAGDVGSIYPVVPPLVRHAFTTAILIRHPIRILNTRLRRGATDADTVSIGGEWIGGVFDMNVEGLSAQDFIFLHDCAVWLCFAVAATSMPWADLLIRIEDTADVPDFLASLSVLTGVKYTSECLTSLIDHRVNDGPTPEAPIEEVLAGFSQRQRDWYFLFVDRVAQKLGYMVSNSAAKPQRQNVVAAVSRRSGASASALRTPGVDRFADINAILGRHPRVIFDVGAHEGDTCIQFLTQFPAARVYGFEASTANYEIAREKLAACGETVELFRAAVADVTGEVSFNEFSHSGTHSLFDIGSQRYWAAFVQKVECTPWGGQVGS